MLSSKKSKVLIFVLQFYYLSNDYIIREAPTLSKLQINNTEKLQLIF